MAMHPVARDTIDGIIEVFSMEVPVIFGDNLAFGFICGSVARKTAHHGDDIDTVIVVHCMVDDQVSRFRNWISELHGKTKMTIDVDFPYELFTVETMHEKFGSLASLRPSLHYVSSATYDTMTWAEMVSNPVKAGIIGDRDLLNSQSQRCIDHVQRWREEIRGDLKREGDRAFKATNYREGVKAKKLAGELQGGDATFFADIDDSDLESFDWVDFSFFHLARLMRRFMPLPDAAPPVPMTDIQEMFLELPILVAGGYRMRALMPRDAEGLHTMCSNPNVARYTSWEPMTREQVETFIAAQIENGQRGECNPWAICEGDEIIGTCSILEVDEGAKSCEIGFALREDRWGQGIATIAANRMIEFIDHELGMREIVAECEAENVASIRLLEKLGLVRVDIKENEVEREGAMRDIFVYKLILR